MKVPILRQPVRAAAGGFLLCAVVLIAAAFAALLSLYFTGAGEASRWVFLHFKEGVSVVLFSFDLAVGLFLLCQRLDGADEMTDPDA